MAWFKVDDGFWSHPKTLALTNDAIALWLRSGTWSCQQLTDGFIADHALPMFGHWPDAVAELVEVGYWDRDENRAGHVFHDWADYQEESEKVKARREAARERMKTVRANSERTKRERAPVVRDVFERSSLNPDPTRPDPTSTSKEVLKATVAKTATGGQRLPEPFMVTKAMREWASEKVPGLNVDETTAAFADYWRGIPSARGKKLDWIGTWRNWLRREANSSPSRVAPAKPSKADRARGVIAQGQRMQAEIDRREIES